jgi:hypothetical protein
MFEGLGVVSEIWKSLFLGFGHKNLDLNPDLVNTDRKNAE